MKAKKQFHIRQIVANIVYSETLTSAQKIDYLTQIVLRTVESEVKTSEIFMEGYALGYDEGFEEGENGDSGASECTPVEMAGQSGGVHAG